MNSKNSRLNRKYLNKQRARADVPWPARRFKYPPTLSPRTLGRCQRLVHVQVRRRKGVLGYVRRPVAQPVVCGGPLRLVPFKGRLECPYCEYRGKVVRRQAKVDRTPATAATVAMRASFATARTVGRLFRRRAK